MSPIFHATRLLCKIMKTIGGLISFIDSSMIVGLYIFFFSTENNPKDVYLKVCFLFSVFYSEDGFYTTWVKAPSEGGQWSVEAVSMSPFHGLRKAQSQPLLRTMPISVAIEGIPSSLKRAEILRNVTIRTRNNMPVPMQVRTYSTIYHHNVPHTSYNVCSLT